MENQNIAEVNLEYTVERNFYYLNCQNVVVLNTYTGYRCGYVGILKIHPLYGVKYDEMADILQSTPNIYFNVHGRITYSGADDYPIKTNPQLWWFGFDCAHLGDAPDLKCIKDEKYRKEVSKVYRILGGTVRDVDFVIDECKLLTEQLNFVYEVMDPNRKKMLNE